MSTIAVRKLPDGRIQARRLDGEPLSDADREEARRMAGAETTKAQTEPPPRAWVIETVTNWATGEVRAVHLCSAPLEAHLWVLHDRDYIPPDDDPIFFEDELEVFKTKSSETMREILKVKRSFPRSRVIQ